MRKHIHLPPSVLILALLQACGGGDDGDGEPAASTAVGRGASGTAASNAGAFSAKSVPTGQKRSILLSLSLQSVSPENLEQADDGAIVRIGSTTFSGSPKTVDIAGDVHFALGRWLKGTVTGSTGADTLTGEDFRSYHYLAYNALKELPTSGTHECTMVAGTAPTTNSSAASLGSASGSASVAFDANGAAVQGKMQVRAAGESTEVDLATHIKNAGQISLRGPFFGSGPGAAITLAAQGSADPALSVGYRAQMPGGALYLGVARFNCIRK